jgi:hypothetical protein
VNSDFFGNAIPATNVVAGPFANAHTGANSYTLWPPAGQVVPNPPAPPADQPVNLSRNAGARAVASYQDGTLVAANAIDGNPSSRWSSDHSNDNNAWIYVDLGGTYNVQQVALSWETAYAKGYKIQVSDNASTWTDVFSTTTGDGGSDTIAVNRSTRYVRMQGVTPNTQWGYSLWEFEVWGTSGTTPPSGGPTVYGDANFTGPSAQLAVGNYDLAQLQALGIANDTISSIRVPSGYVVTGYADAGFAGTAWTFRADNTNLLNTGNNDAISSLRVTTA